jgi:hypothetical protein
MLRDARVRRLIDVRLKNTSQLAGFTRRDDRFDAACLLCSEPEAVHCHRRVAAEFLQLAWGDLAIVHL